MSEELKKEAQILKKKTEEEEKRVLTEKELEHVAGGTTLDAGLERKGTLTTDHD